MNILNEINELRQILIEAIDDINEDKFIFNQDKTVHQKH